MKLVDWFYSLVSFLNFVAFWIIIYHYAVKFW
jgi:hypothetical protein